MLMEKETTGIYITGHPMDDFRQLLKNTSVVPIGKLTEEDAPFKDDRIVSIAGVVQSVKNKTPRNNSSMAYVTIEDDTGSIELIAFSKVITEYGGYMRENAVLVVTGRLSIRDDKEPQIVVNRARPISDYEKHPWDPAPVAAQRPVNARHEGTLYLRLPTEDEVIYPKVRAILNMFPGDSQVVLYFADTKVRRGTRCCIMDSMLSELRYRLGESNVVLK